MNEATTTASDAKQVFFPLDEQLGLVSKRYSPGLEKEMVWLSGAEKSFVHAEDVMRRIGHIKISEAVL